MLDRFVLFDRRRRLGGIGRQNLGLIPLGLLFSVVILQALFEGLHTLGQIAHEIGHTAGTEQQQNDGKDDDPMPNAERTHSLDASNLTTDPAVRRIIAKETGWGNACG
jgi:hypothetical protein